MHKIWCEKYLYFGTSLYDQDKHWYFGKNSCCDSKFFPGIQIRIFVVDDEVLCNAKNSFSLFFIHGEVAFYGIPKLSQVPLFVILLLIWRIILHFSYKDLFVSFLYTADIFLNYHWIKAKFRECYPFEKKLKFFIGTLNSKWTF